jgi:hypothetical protein
MAKRTIIVGIKIFRARMVFPCGVCDGPDGMGAVMHLIPLIREFIPGGEAKTF